MKGRMDGPDLLARIHEHLAALRLKSIKTIVDDEIRRATEEGTPLSVVVERLFAAEREALTNRRIERRITDSKLIERKLLSDFDFAFQKGIDKQQVMELATLGFIERKQGLIIAGNSGTGKSHIAKALLLLACKKNYTCRYVTASEMLTSLMAALPAGNIERAIKRYTKPEVLLIDEVGFSRLEQESARNANLFFKVIDGRYCRGCTIVTSNVDFAELGDYLGDPVATTAIVDRMVHHSIIINVEGPSWRAYESKKLNRKPSPPSPPKEKT